MINQDRFGGKKITVAGLARSGYASANLLYKLGADVYVTDNRDNDLTRSYAAELAAKGIKVEIGSHSADFIKGKDLLVVSPGIPDSAPPIVMAGKFNVPAISEIELGWLLCPAAVIAVTGSNGKTTVTTLIGMALKAAGKRVFVCGNIGNPFCGEVEKMETGDFVSLEVSSFQLEMIREFKPEISLILNFSRNHLDRYKDIQEYLRAKKRIFMNQDSSDCLILNKEDPLSAGLAAEANARVEYFSGGEGFNPNQSALLSVAGILGIDKAVCLEVFRNFKGIEHRLEYVRSVNGVDFINDSKSTTVDSTVWALNNISSPVLLIAGGRDKGSDYGAISGLIRQRSKNIILIGEARQKIRKALEGYRHIDEAASLKEAVRLAFSRAAAGDCVLLSPMCSSYDMFTNFEERGRAFKEAVFELAKDDA